MPIGQCNPHQSTLPSHQPTPTTLFFKSSMTFFKSSSNYENTTQFWEGVSSGPLLQSPRRERHPPVLARLDTPTPTGPACRGIPQTRHPQCQAPINNNSSRKDIAIWNNHKHTHHCDSEDILFGLLLTQTDILLQMPSSPTLIIMPSTPGPGQVRQSGTLLGSVPSGYGTGWEGDVGGEGEEDRDVYLSGGVCLSRVEVGP